LYVKIFISKLCLTITLQYKYNQCPLDIDYTYIVIKLCNFFSFFSIIHNSNDSLKYNTKASINFMISFANALEMAISNLQKPIISKFEIFYIALEIEKKGSYNNNVIKKQKNINIEKINYLIEILLDKGFISKDIDFKSYYKINSEDRGNCEEICCMVDPFCYLSHLSAMQKYGLTNRIPELVILTTPKIKLWKEMKNDLENTVKLNFQDKMLKFAKLKKTSFPSIVRKMKVKLLKRTFIHPSIKMRDSYARISEIGHTFLDMLINPELCGGMSHIIEVWQNNGKNYINEIIEAIDKHPQDIIKCRAGYIIDEILKISDKRIEKWLKFAQRGGSRKLDPNAPYSSKFSEKWIISVNV
jgi:predicted transcriptional regulator of viral defense system